MVRTVRTTFLDANRLEGLSKCTTDAEGMAPYVAAAAAEGVAPQVSATAVVGMAP